MKIKKKNTTIPINGKIVDTENVEDKTSNAPSLRLVEEMVKENYSTEEQAVGTWINGKPIYRKVIVNTAFKTDSYKIADDIEQFINQFGYVQRKDYPGLCQIINSRVGSNMSIQFSISDVYAGIQIDWGSNWKNNYSTLFNKIIIVAEYTKTTD